MELKGTPVSPGIAVGHALLVEREAYPTFRLLVPPEDVEPEVQRLTRAVDASRRQLCSVKERLSREAGVLHAYVFDAQLLMLEDPLLLGRTLAVIRDEHVNAEWALRTVSDRLHDLFDELSDEYLRERRTDLDDVLGRVLLNLSGAGDAPSLQRLPGRFVLVADDLSPSEAAEIDWDHVLAVASDAGSPTYHTAIIARARGIPAVVGLGDATRRIPPGALVIVDGTRGVVVVEPSGPTLDGYRSTGERERAEDLRLRGTSQLPAVTLDGVPVRLLANAEFPEEAATAVLYGAQGIGLFRSEYLLGRGRRFPSEAQQVEVYHRLLLRMHPHPVTVRTWDVGPEDVCPGGPTSPNPALGERGLRLLPRAPQPFRTQLRALLRAAAHGPLRLMLSFVAGPDDLAAALALIEEVAAELRAEGVPFRADPPVGINLELPSAAATVDLMAGRLAFISVGTNDLIQYLLAVDRVDPRVARFYEPLHPAVLRTIDGIVRQAAAHGVPVALCGEMAADPLCALAALGLGVHELSMTPASIPRVKAAIRAVTDARARAVARVCLSLPSASTIEDLLRRELGMALEERSPGKELL